MAKDKGGSPVVNPVRVQRLLQKSKREHAYTDIVRIIKILERKINIDSLLDLLYWWNPKAKRGIAEDYFSNTSKK